MPRTKQKTSEESKPIDVRWVEERTRTFRQKFNTEAENFMWLMKHGGGIDNIHMLQTIRNLHMLYLETAAHEEVSRSASGNGECQHI